MNELGGRNSFTVIKSGDVSVGQVVEEIHDRLLEDLDVRVLQRLPEHEARQHVQEAVAQVLNDVNGKVTGVMRQTVIREVTDEILGFGPLQPLLDEPEITEVMVNGPHDVYYERVGVLYVSSARFRDYAHVRRIADRIVAPVGRRLDESSPMVDARLPDGSRVNIVLAPIAVSGPVITIRKFQHDRFDMDDLIRIGSVTEAAAGFLRAAVVSKINLVISGGTDSGKPESTDGLGCAGCRARNGRLGGCGSGWWRWQGATVAVRACGQEETAVGRRSQACWCQAVERSARPSGVRSGAGSPAAGRGRR